MKYLRRKAFCLNNVFSILSQNRENIEKMKACVSGSLYENGREEEEKYALYVIYSI